MITINGKKVNKDIKKLDLSNNKSKNDFNQW